MTPIERLMDLFSTNIDEVVKKTNKSYDALYAFIVDGECLSDEAVDVRKRFAKTIGIDERWLTSINIHTLKGILGEIDVVEAEIADEELVEEIKELVRIVLINEPEEAIKAIHV